MFPISSCSFYHTSLCFYYSGDLLRGIIGSATINNPFLLAQGAWIPENILEICGKSSKNDTHTHTPWALGRVPDQDPGPNRGLCVLYVVSMVSRFSLYYQYILRHTGSLGEHKLIFDKF